MTIRFDKPTVGPIHARMKDQPKTLCGRDFRRVWWIPGETENIVFMYGMKLKRTVDVSPTCTKCQKHYKSA